LEIKKEDILKVLSDVSFSDTKLLENDERYRNLLRSVAVELEINQVEDSRNVVSFEFVNISQDFSSLVKNFESGVLFYFVPEFGNHDDLVWHYPIFRFIRTKKQIESELRRLGVKTVKHYILSGSLRAAVFEK